MGLWGINVKVEISHQCQILREWGHVEQYILQLTEDSSNRTRWVINVENIEARLTTLKFTRYRLVWVGRMIEVHLWTDEINRPTPPPLLCDLSFLLLFFWDLSFEKPSGVISVRSAEVSLVVSRVSMMPRSILLLVMKSEKTGALSRLEQACTVPRRRLNTPEPGFRLSSTKSVFGSHALKWLLSSLCFSSFKSTNWMQTHFPDQNNTH